MRRTLSMLMAFLLALPAAASHTWADIDLCELHKDKLPPGLTAESLPDPQSREAGLLQRYCTQCHNLPGPDRHTAAEWRDVVSKMVMLMEVSHRFGGLMGNVETLPEPEQTRLLGYLQRHAKPPAIEAKTDDTDLSDRPSPTRPWVLIPLLLLMTLGLLRWRRLSQRGKNHD